jgi:hypothetical protein
MDVDGCYSKFEPERFVSRLLERLCSLTSMGMWNVWVYDQGYSSSQFRDDGGLISIALNRF